MFFKFQFYSHFYHLSVLLLVFYEFDIFISQVGCMSSVHTLSLILIYFMYQIYYCNRFFTTIIIIYVLGTTCMENIFY